MEAEDAALKVLAHQLKDGQGSNNWSALWLLRSSTYRLPLVLTMAANAAQQFSGINAVSAPELWGSATWDIESFFDHWRLGVFRIFIL